MKHMISSQVKCPYYKHEDSQMIYCDGVQDGSTIHLAFANKTEALDYKKSFCRTCYSDCHIFRMHEGNSK